MPSHLPINSASKSYGLYILLYKGILPPFAMLGSGEINHFGPGENRQSRPDENRQSRVASPQTILFTRPAAGQPVSQ